jgi:hypothetical protein
MMKNFYTIKPKIHPRPLFPLKKKSKSFYKTSRNFVIASLSSATVRKISAKFKTDPGKSQRLLDELVRVFFISKEDK